MTANLLNHSNCSLFERRRGLNSHLEPWLATGPFRKRCAPIEPRLLACKRQFESFRTMRLPRCRIWGIWPQPEGSPYNCTSRWQRGKISTTGRMSESLKPASHSPESRSLMRTSPCILSLRQSLNQYLKSCRTEHHF